MHYSAPPPSQGLFMFQSPVADSQQTVVKGYEIEWMNESINIQWNYD